MLSYYTVKGESQSKLEISRPFSYAEPKAWKALKKAWSI